MLGRHVFERTNCAAAGFGHFARISDARYTKISQLDAAFSGQQHVSGLDIAVNDLVAMRIVKRSEQIRHHESRLLQREALALVEKVL